MTDRDDIDAMLTRHFSAAQETDGESAARVQHALSTARLPRQHGRPWLRWPSVLLQWDMTPAWPRMAALAGCAALGFVLGLAGLDARLNEAAARMTVASADLTALYDIDTLTGLRP